MLVACGGQSAASNRMLPLGVSSTPADQIPQNAGWEWQGLQNSTLPNPAQRRTIQTTNIR